MAFYDVSYSVIGDDIMVENNGNQWNIDVIEGFGKDNNNYDFVQQTLRIISSYKYASPEDEVAVEDILLY